MPTTDTRRDLLAAIAREPDDDVLRLAFADWLDEQGDKRVKCPVSTCGNPGVGWDGFYRCRRCDGTGTILDASDRDRAELIRVQIELAALGHPAAPIGTTPRSVNSRWDKIESLQTRESALLRAHPEWLAAPCPTCGGSGEITSLVYSDSPMVHGGFSSTGIPCPTCHGTGDLMKHTYAGTPRRDWCRRVHVFARGFMASVTLTRGEAFSGEEPSKLARGLVKAFPTLQRMPLSDRKPNHNSWFVENEYKPQSPAHLPSALFDGLALNCDYIDSDMQISFKQSSTHGAVNDAMAVEMCRLAKRKA